MLTIAEFFQSVSTASVDTHNSCQRLLQLTWLSLHGTCLTTRR